MGTVSINVPGPGTYQVKCDPNLDPLPDGGSAADVLAGKQFYKPDSSVVTGSMPDNPPENVELEPGENYDIPRGYHSGGGRIAARAPAIDPAPAYGSGNPVASGGVYTALEAKQNRLTGTQGQVVGFNADGEAVPQSATDAGVTAFHGRTGAVQPMSGDYTAEMVGARPDTWTPTAVQIGAVPTGRKVNGKALSEDITLSASDIGVNAPAGMTSTNVQGAVSELFTSVSEGKALIASAVTDKGVQTPADASFQTMHNNILAIKSGGLPEGMYTITLSASPPEGGTVTGAGAVSDGMTVTVSASPNTGFEFEDWTDENDVYLTDHNDGEYTFAVRGNWSLVAKFKVKDRLPKDYTEVQFIGMSAAKRYTHIQTEYLVTSEDIITITAQSNNTNNSGKILGYSLTSTTRAECYVQSLSNSSYGKKGTPVFMLTWNKYTTFDTVVGTSSATYRIDFPNQSITVTKGETTETKKAAASFSPTAYSKLSFFDAVYQNNDCFSGSIYKCTITDAAGTVKADFVPCKTASGVIGFYESIAGKFYTVNQNSEYLVAGPEV